MTDICIKWKGEPFTMTVSGHARAKRNAEGHDLVCCAVATIAQTLAASCMSLEGVQSLFRTDDGFSNLIVSDTEAHWDELVPRFQMAIDGLTVLSAQYPDNITLTATE